MENSVFGPAMKKFAEKLTVDQQRGLKEAAKGGYDAVVNFAKTAIPVDLHFDLIEAWEDDNDSDVYDGDVHVVDDDYEYSDDDAYDDDDDLFFHKALFVCCVEHASHQTLCIVLAVRLSRSSRIW